MKLRVKAHKVYTWLSQLRSTSILSRRLPCARQQIFHMDVLYSKVQVHTSKRQLFLLLMPAQSPVNCTLCKWKFATPEKLLERKHFFMGLFKQSNCVTGSVISVNIISCFICVWRANSIPQITSEVCVLCNT